MSEELQFRTAAVGGFVKQDVMTYLQRSAGEHAEKLTALLKELNEAKQARAEGEASRNALEERVAALESENQRLTAELSNQEAQRQALETSKAELEKLAAQLQSRVNQLLPVAAAYKTVRDRTASIELEAHGRAQQIENESQQKAQKLREEANQWFGNMQTAYDRLHADMGEAVARATKELEQVKAILESFHGVFGGYERGLSDLGSQIETIAGPILPEPLPLEGND